MNKIFQPLVIIIGGVIAFILWKLFDKEPATVEVVAPTTTVPTTTDSTAPAAVKTPDEGYKVAPVIEYSNDVYGLAKLNADLAEALAQKGLTAAEKKACKLRHDQFAIPINAAIKEASKPTPPPAPPVPPSLLSGGPVPPGALQ